MIVRCKCSRQQAITQGPADLGVTLERAKEIGWTVVDGEAICPHCGGNINLLRQAFAPPEPEWRKQAIRIMERRRRIAEELQQMEEEGRQK